LGAAEPPAHPHDPGPRCARHLHRDASERCEICGDQLCEACLTVACEAEDCPRAAPAGQSWAAPVPWEAGASLGWLRGLVLTWQRLLLQPQRFFRSLPLTSSVRPALIFAATCFTLGSGVMMLAVAWRELPGSALPLLLALSALPFLGLYRALLLAGLFWVGLGVISGRAPPFRGLLRVTCYGLAADLLLPLAGLGVYAAAALHALGLRKACDRPWWQAILVACLPLALFHLLVLGALAIYLSLSGRSF